MNRKEIAAFLLGCQVEDFMGYADQAELGVVVIGPDGKKYRFSVGKLEKAFDIYARFHGKDAGPKPKPPSKAGTGKPKPKTKRTTKRQPSKPKTKTGAKP